MPRILSRRLEVQILQSSSNLIVELGPTIFINFRSFSRSLEPISLICKAQRAPLSRLNANLRSERGSDLTLYHFLHFLISMFLFAISVFSISQLVKNSYCHDQKETHSLGVSGMCCSQQ